MVLVKRHSNIKHASKALIVELAVVCSNNLSMTWWIGATIWPRFFGQDFSSSVTTVNATGGGVLISLTRTKDW